MEKYLPYIAGFGLIGAGMAGLYVFGEDPFWYTMIGTGIGILVREVGAAGRAISKALRKK